ALGTTVSSSLYTECDFTASATLLLIFHNEFFCSDVSAKSTSSQSNCWTTSTILSHSFISTSVSLPSTSMIRWACIFSPTVTLSPSTYFNAQSIASLSKNSNAEGV